MAKQNTLYTYTHVYVHVHTYTHIRNGLYLALKKKEILPIVTTRMDLEGIRLSEIIQTKKDLHSYVKSNSKNKKVQKTELWDWRM